MRRYLQPVTYVFGLLLLCGMASCKRESPKDATLSLTAFSPEQGSEGSTIVLTGVNFSASREKNIVKFNGIEAVVTEVANDRASLSVTVPEEAKTGKITVRVGNQEVVSAKDFMVNPLAPSISQITPDKGAGGSTIVITGNNFIAPVKVLFVQLEGQDVTVVNKNRIQVKAPAGVLTGKIKVISNGMEAISAGEFYGAPIAAAITPGKASEGQEVQISGINFDPVAANNTVKFGTVVAEVLAGSTINRLKLKVPVGAANGRVSITVRGMTTSTTNEFSLGAVITDFSPKHGEPGSSVVITGKNFAPNAIVKMGNTACTIQKSEANSITFTIPGGDELADNKFTLVSDGISAETVTAFEVTNIWKKLVSGGANHLGGVCFVINNRIFLAGGVSNGNVNEFDLATNTWKLHATMPADIAQEAGGSVMVLNNKAYVGSFTSNVNKTAMWYEYDPLVTGAGAWKRMTDYPELHATTGFAMNLNNQLYYGLGKMFVVPFNPAANNGQGEWGTRYVLNCPNKSGTWSFVINGLGYFGGGVDDRNVSRFESYAFHPGTGQTQITPIAPLAQPTRRAPAYSLNGKGYVIVDNTPYEYLQSLNVWAVAKFKIPDFPKYAVVANNSAYAISIAGAVYKFVPNR